jgi:hypothetical protein
MSEEHRYSEAAESDDELPLPQGVRVQVTKRPEAAVLTSQAEPRFVKFHKARISAKQSKQSTRRDLLTVLGKKPAPTAKTGGRGSAKKDASYGGNGRPCAWYYAHWFPKDQIKYPGKIFQHLMLRNKPLRPMLRLSCPLLTCFRFEDGAQLRCSSAELFARC